MKKAIYALILIPALFLSVQVFGSYAIARFDNEWCSGSYPTTYVTGSFFISETDINGMHGFTRNQVSKTLEIGLPAGFEFKTSGTTASISASGTEIAIVSFSFISATQLIVTITTSSTNTEYNTIYFNNFEIKALNGSASGNVLRSGGTFQIDNSTANPTSAQSFGFLSSVTPFVYAASSVDQPNLTDVKQYTINNDILRIKISGSGNCGEPVTQFTFSTDGNNGTGTDSLRNIIRAKVYYTGNSSVFAPTSFFGSYTAPSGNFVISGSINLVNGDNYFWLCYDVPGDAYTGLDGNKVDASLISFAIDGTSKSDMTTPTPTGHRNVVPSEFYYTTSSGNWTDDIWSVINNGPLCHCQPNGAGIVIIDTAHAVLMNDARTVDVMQVMKDASLIGQSASRAFGAAVALITYDNGYFDFLGDITVVGNMTLNGSGTSNFHKNLSIGGDLYIATGATLNNDAVSTLDIQLDGNLTVNGILQNTGANIFMNGGNAYIDGTGIINATYVVIKNGSKTVNPAANLYINAGLKIQGPYVVDNFGKMNIRGNMDADNAVSHWINESGSDLSYGGSVTMFATNGYMAAFSEFNTVHYSGSSDQCIVLAQHSTYYTLALEGSGIKLMVAEMHLHGNFICNAAFDHNQKAVIIDGIIMQYFSGSVPPTLYNLIMLNSAEGLTLQLPVFYESLLTLTSGKIFTTMTNILTAKDNATTTSGSEISFVNGPMQKVGNDAFVFPVGKNSIWARIGISAPQLTSAPFIAEYFYEKYSNTTSVTKPLDHVSTLEYWNLLRNAGSDSVKVQLYWESAARSYITAYSSNLVVAGWSGTSWLSKSQSAITSADPGNITSVVVKIFGPFTFGSNSLYSNPLPIELSSFDAKPDNDFVNITWTTTSETNNDYFTIEKSMDAINFETVATVGGAGNSNTTLYYSETDNYPFTGVSYYRLKQTDFDGKFSYSNIMKVDFEKSVNINIYPNPFNSSISITINDASEMINYKLRIYNAFGEEVMNTSVTKPENTFETSNLQSGTYSYEVIRNDKTIQSGKLISKQ